MITHVLSLHSSKIPHFYFLCHFIFQIPIIGKQRLHLKRSSGVNNNCLIFYHLDREFVIKVIA